MSRKQITNFGKLFQPRFETAFPVASPYTVLQADFLTGIAGSYTVNLPEIAKNFGRVLSFKMTTAGNTVITPFAGNTIDGAATFILSGLGASLILQADTSGGNWRILSYSPTLTAFVLTDAATIAIDAANGGDPMICDVTLAGNRTLGAPTNPTNTRRIIIRVKQDGTGSRTLAYNAVYRFPSDIPSPTLSTAAGTTDIIAFVYNTASVKWDCVAAIMGYL